MKKYGFVLTLSVMVVASCIAAFFVFHTMEPTPKERRLIAVERVERTELDAHGNTISVKQFRRKVFKHVPISEGTQTGAK